MKQIFRIYQGKRHEVDNVKFVNTTIPVHTILANNEFQALKEDAEELGVNVNVLSKDEHLNYQRICR